MTDPTASQAIFSYFVCDTLNEAGEDGMRFLRVDFQIDCNSAGYWLFMPYVIMMLLVYPIGVPILYMVLLYRHRHLLAELRQLELALENHKLEVERTRQKASSGRATELGEQRMMTKLLEAQEVYIKRLEEQIIDLIEQVPPTLRKLTAGYQFKCYWFEVFECFRKISLVGLPVIFRPGSTEQQVRPLR